MDILIIEDEPGTAAHLENMIIALDSNLRVLDVVDSISVGQVWFSENKQPDLILSDIQLADGLSFELFKSVEISCPIIFCTAYDEYAINSFETNGIDYLLKPIDEKKLSESLKRYHLLSNHFTMTSPYLNQLLEKVEHQLHTYKTNFLIAFQNKMIPIGTKEIAFFYTENGNTKVYTLSGKGYTVSFTLEQLEQLLDPKMFFRANRQYIISYGAIGSVEPCLSRKTSVNIISETPTPLLISKKRSPIFLNWLRER
ncbi:LytTR family DNA-binding domain-containing protein [Muricauda sp. 334s03]|uniref:LytTR family DNA-binding domain-containing protein n=1 Tax=Flagellimonas yonaguniensis TaxID=3031325 RepID=A0ABT5XYT2_9FLAO|nr:LytTR family DNA-binding domain-containing protein [[Muricauda] yonaguniensis]MDF0715977.1 LytTR family DNA-binding domain-containing protein [[Muricauda] yonaguniensis]